MIEDKLHSKPLVSVIVLDFDGQRFWPDLLAALANQSFRDFELIVVENGSSLDLPDSVGEIPVRRLKGEGNLGFAGGVNFANRHAAGELLALLNNDAVPERDWLLELVGAMAEDSGLGAVCSKVLFYDRYVKVEARAPVFRPDLMDGSDDDRSLGLRVQLANSQPSLHARRGTHGFEGDGGRVWIWTKEEAVLHFPVTDSREALLTFESHRCQAGKVAELRIGGAEPVTVELSGGRQTLRLAVPQGAAFDVVNNAGSAFDSDWKVVEVGLYDRDGPAHSRRCELEIASACSILLRRSAIEGDPFDSAFFAYFEDGELSCRLRRAGWRIGYQPSSVVRHHGSATSGIQSPMQVFHSVRNRLWLIAMHAPWRVVARVFRCEMARLDRYDFWLDDCFTLRRLKREALLGSLKRLWFRLCDFD